MTMTRNPDFDSIETKNPDESGIYVWDHVADEVAASGFDCKEDARIWAVERGPTFEPVDARPLRSEGEQ